MKQRNPYTVCGGVRLAIDKMTACGVGRVVGKSGSLVSKWSDKDEDAKPSIYQCIQIDAAYEAAGHGKGPVLAAALAEVSALSDSSRPVARCLNEDIVDMASNLGSAADRIREAWADRSLTPNERCEVETALHTLAMSIDACRANLNALCEGEKPEKLHLHVANQLRAAE